MSYKKAEVKQEAPEKSLKCVANGCPLNYSNEPEMLCSYHCWSDPKQWFYITERLNHEGPWNLDVRKPVDITQHKADPKGWAKRLRDRDESGERISQIQITMYKAALAKELPVIDYSGKPQ